MKVDLDLTKLSSTKLTKLIEQATKELTTRKVKACTQIHTLDILNAIKRYNLKLS